MDREELENTLADYLARELDPASMRRFEAALEEHPDLAREAAELQRTLCALHARSPSPLPELRESSTQPWRAALIAAALILVFLLGYYTRGVGMGAGPSPIAPEIAEHPEDLPAADPSWQAEIVRAYNRPRSESPLARSLIAFSHALAAKE